MSGSNFVEHILWHREHDLPLITPVTSWTPTLKATTTNPTLGSGSNVSGQYSVVGGWCHGWVRWRFGSSGVSPGSGVYFFDLPVPAHPSGVTSNTFGEATVIGYGTLRDNGAGASFQRTGIAVVLSTGATTGRFYVDGGGTTQVSHSHPQTWAANDRISIQFSYPVDPNWAP